MSDVVTLSYELRPRARVSAGQTASVLNARQVHRVVPGTVVRGALGGAWWGGRGGFEPTSERDALFDRVFRPMRVNGAVPHWTGPVKPEDQPPGAVLAALSQWRCKYECDDRRTPWVEWRPEVKDHPCPNCQGPSEAGKGWDTDAALMASTTRTALEHGVAKTEQLFTRKALRTTLTLAGSIVLRGDPAELDPVVEWLTTERELSIGGQRSTLGRCRWTCHATAHPEPATGEVTVRLRSPAILVDNLGSAALDLAAVVAASIASEGGRGEVVGQAVRPVVIGGWNGMAGLPKPEEYAVGAGSAVWLSGLDAAGARAITRGLGLRQAEGYGEVELVASQTGLTAASTAHSGTPERSDPAVASHDAPRPVDVSPMTSQSTASPPTVGASAAASAGAEVVQSSPAGDVAPQEGAAPKERDDVGDLIASIGPGRAAATLKGIRAQARAVRRWRENGFPEQLVRSRVLDPLESLPWMRDLSGEHQRGVRALLERPTPELSLVIARVDELMEETR